MGLKDVVERLAGKRSTAQRGSRGPRERKRDRDEPTIQVQSPIASGSMPTAPPPHPTPQPQAPPRAAPPQPAPPPQPQPAAPVPPAASPPAVPVSSSPPPAAAAPPPPAASPPKRPAGDAEATQYVTIPPIESGELVGVLVGIAGELKGEIHKLFDGDSKLGRAQGCDVVLLDPKISREHAKVLCEGGELVIIPLSAKNPVYVNDVPVEEADQLADGDMLRLGNPGSSTFRFRTIEGL